MPFLSTHVYVWICEFVKKVVCIISGKTTFNVEIAQIREDIDNQDAKFEKYSHKKSKIYRKYLHILKEISIFAKIFTVQ